MKQINLKRKGVLIATIVLLATICGVTSAAVFTMFSAQNTATVKTVDVQLIAGSDSVASPTTFPAATVTVASTKDYANVAFSLFPSATNTPQPRTYYTDLLQIKNVGTASHTLKNISLLGLTNVANLGNVTVYLYGTQTDAPETGTPIASASLSSTSTGTVAVLSSAYTITAGSSVYFELVGYAGASATAGSTIGFTTQVNWE